MSKYFLIIFFPLLAIFFIASFFISVNKGSPEEEVIITTKQLKEIPDEINAIYLTGPYLASEYRLNNILNLIEDTEINSVVIDVKDFSGRNYLDEDWIYMDKIIERLHENNVYSIARIAAFEDPKLSSNRNNLAIKNKQGDLWKTYTGLSWVDPSSKEVWDYNIEIAKKAWNLGFDEINFDYIRFPTDGDLTNINYPFFNEEKTKRETMIEFYSYLRDKLKSIKISADLFGLTTLSDDIGVGQNIEDAGKYFDFVCPMVYPSHYASGFQGYLNPSEYPYEVVYKSLAEANKKITNLRPWLQAFDLLGYEYDRDEIQKQIKAAKDALLENYHGYMLWNSQNKYIKEGLQ
ncbi:MAG: putative glycoside hydrolase [Candidatus Pacebacteria bacterium]|nr:putative glycoside hydrolase [Candidatus Paceibacterota bacterium]